MITGDNNISKKDNICIKNALFQYISKIGMKLWFYRCHFTPLDVPTSCFLPFQWQFTVQRFGFKWSLLFCTGRFILGQQPCAELAVQEDKKKKNDYCMTVMSELKLLVMMLMLPKFIFKVNIFLWPHAVKLGVFRWSLDITILFFSIVSGSNRRGWRCYSWRWHWKEPRCIKNWWWSRRKV